MISRWLFLGLLVGLCSFMGCPTKEEPYSALSEEAEGKVEKVEGEALVHRAGTKAPVHLRLGDPVFQGDVVRTQGSASLEIRLVDGTVLMVRPLSRFKLNERMAGSGEGPSVMLFSGRILSRVLSVTEEDLFSVETPTLVATTRGTEFEVAISEDLGGLIAVYHGKVELLTEGEPVMLGPQREAEIEFADGPAQVRQFKDKGETDWAAWMMSRSRDLAGRLVLLSEKIPARLSNLHARREEERSVLIRRLGEIESLAREIAEAKVKGDSRALDGLVRRFKEDFSGHRQCVKRLQTVGNRVEALHEHAGHLVNRAKGLKKALGKGYDAAVGSLNLVLDGRKEFLKVVEEDRVLLRDHRKQAKLLLEGVPEARSTAKDLQETGTKAEPKKVVPQEMKKGPPTPSRKPSGGTTAEKEKAKRYPPAPKTQDKKGTERPQGKSRTRSVPPGGAGAKVQDKSR